METKPSAVILRERAPNNNGEALGWIIILAGQAREREVLAVIAHETGLDCARSFAQIIATKFKVKVKEELRTDNGVAANQDASLDHYPQA